MKTIKYYGLLLLLLCSSAATQAQLKTDGQFVKVNSWQSLLDLAKKEHKMIFIDSYFVGCHPCKQMDDEVFPLSDVIQQMKENFVSVKIDFMVEELGKALQVKYAVTGFPTFLILDENGQLVSRFSGYQEADVFQKRLAEAKVKAKKGELMTGFSGKLEVAHPEFYTQMFSARKPMVPQDMVNYLAQNKDVLKEEQAVPFLMMKSINPEWNAYFLEHYAEFESKYGQDLASGKRAAIINSRLKGIGGKVDAQAFEAFLKTVRPYYSDASWPYAKLDIAEGYYYNLHKDHKSFFKYAAANFNDDSNKVRYMAMYLNQPKVDEEEKQLFAKWMKLVVTADATYEVLNTASSIMMAQKDVQQAKIYAGWGLKKAAALKKSDRYFKEILEQSK
ncbi:thioredoxin family protein [Pedobacter gandavensis]|uniref:thioredoxin family protein n=1 Tax=Pedobacter gandavensis TaxID=2679963 RepID=UPI00247A7AC3|nr:thioredoxin family protein [Pedobacter gandavensis]WGQ10080.1 thioredoxin family protein [Pedobacter gandavensis]